MVEPRTATVIGLGVVGLATAQLLQERGFDVFGHDIDPEALKRFDGHRLDQDALIPVTDLTVIAVPSPTENGRMSAAPLEAALGRVRATLEASEGNTVLAIRTTMVPGTTDRVVRPALDPLVQQGRVSVCVWPSFARERQALADELSPRVLVFGADDTSLVEPVMVAAAGEQQRDLILWMQPVEAELTKHGANAFNALKISYFNAIGDWARERGADGRTVAIALARAAEGAWNPEYGTRVGPAFGGACLPKDLDALIAEVEATGSPHGDLLRAIRTVNSDPWRAE